MAERVETTLAYKLDARGLRDARREFEKTFKPDSAEALNESMSSMEDQLKRLTKEQVQLNTQMEKVKRGTEAYKVLERALGDVEKRARSTRGALANLNATAPEAPKAPQAPKATPTPSTGRVAVAAGVGGYLGGRAGVARDARSMATGAGHRAAGVLGGSGPLSTVTAGIPLIGGLAAMAEGAVGSFLSNRQAQLGALPFVGDGGGFAGIAEQAGAAARKHALSQDDLGKIRAKGIGDHMRAFGGQTGQQSTRAGRRELKRKAMLQLSSEGNLPGMSSTQVADLQSSGESIRLTTLPFEARTPVSQRARKLELAARRGGEGEGLSTFANRERANAGDLAVRRATAAAEARATAAREQAIADGFRRVTGNIQGIGARAGLAPQEAMQAATQMGQITGRTNAAQFQQGLAGQFLGVDTSTTARLFRGQRAGRGGTEGDDINILASAIGGAVALGLEGSEVNEHLSMIAGLQEQAEQRGMKVSAEGFQTMAASLAGGGVSGIQAARISSGFARQGQNLAATGPKSAEDIALLRAGGFKAGAGFSNYFSALKGVEDVSSDPEMLFDFLRNLTSGADLTTEEGRAKGAYTIARTSFGRESVGSIRGAESLIGALQGGSSEAFTKNLSALGAIDPETGEANLAQLAPGGGTAKGLAAFTGMTKEGGGAAGATARMLLEPLERQAKIAGQLIDVGGKVAGTVQTLNSNAVQLASSVGELHKVIDVAVPVIKAISAYLETGIKGTAGFLAGAVEEGAGHPP